MDIVAVPSPFRTTEHQFECIEIVINVIDKIIQINDNDAFKMMRDLARKEGLLVGISSGAAVSVAVQVAQNCNYKGKRIVVLLPDTGERYLSMNIASIHDLEDY